MATDSTDSTDDMDFMPLLIRQICVICGADTLSGRQHYVKDISRRVRRAGVPLWQDHAMAANSLSS